MNAVIATAVFMAIAATGVLGAVEQTNGRSNFWFMRRLALTGARAAQ
jgi:hypothetical protein